MFEKLKAGSRVLASLKYVLSARQKRLGFVTLFLSLVGAVLQMLGISIIVPLVTLMTNPESLLNNQWVQWLCLSLGIDSSDSLFVFICIGTIVLYIAKNLFGIFQLWVSTRYANLIERELAARVMENYMNRTYDFFLRYDTAKILRDAEQDPAQVNSFLRALFGICNEMFTVFLIIIYIVLADWHMALCIGAMAILCLVIIYRFFKSPLKCMGNALREATAMHQKVFQEAIGGIKEVQVMRKQQFFLEAYNNTFIEKQKPAIYWNISASSPTFVIEGIFVAGLMAYICLCSLLDPSYAMMVPMLASFAMGAIRMLPSLGRISTNLNTFSFTTPAVYSMADNLRKIDEQKRGEGVICRMKKRNLGEKHIESFSDNLSVRGICWHYDGTDRQVLKDLDLTVYKGQSIGLIGQTGAGKSTLADVILGLHIPQSGQVLLDGVDIFSMPDEYARVIGYVPQTIYLVDGSIRENVAFGEDLEDVRDEEIWEALSQAQLAEFVRGLEEGLDTVIGERGVRFSGGQRQRLAIARALYRKPQILVLDEATSALDNETEAAVMDAIEHLYGTITMIIIAHRLTTVAKCDVVYEIKDGKAVKTRV